MSDSNKNKYPLQNTEKTLDQLVGNEVIIFCHNKTYKGTLIYTTSDGVILQCYTILNRKGYSIDYFESDEFVYIKLNSIEAFSKSTTFHNLK